MIFEWLEAVLRTSVAFRMENRMSAICSIAVTGAHPHTFLSASDAVRVLALVICASCPGNLGATLEVLKGKGMLVR